MSGRRRNPFTPSFGQVPPYLAGRELIVDELCEAFDNGVGDPNLSTILIGARGTGKTVLLTKAGEEAAQRGWIVANVTAMPGMLDDIVQRTTEAAAEFIDADAVRLKGVSIGQVLGVEWEHVDEPANWRTKMNGLFGALAKHDVGLLITVDEVRADIDEMVQLAANYQLFVREGRKVALLMAGLPYNVSQLLNDKSVSFLRRARQHRLGRIPDFEIEDAIIRTVEEGGRTIGAEALQQAVAASEGFPFMMQLVGYRAWAAHPSGEEIDSADVARGILLAHEEMRTGVFESTIRDLSAGDMRFLRAMLPDPDDSAMGDITARMGVTSGYASQYRLRLLEQGIIGERGRGRVGFDIPGFKAYLAEQEEA